MGIHIKRYRKMRWFFTKIILHTVWWDVILNVPILRFFRTSPLHRWQRIARHFRTFAVEMGGVMIKLGQFLSIRVDILPREVTDELEGLQDDVPPEKIDYVIAQIEEDFNRPFDELFDWISHLPVGAASLAQAHLVRIFSGEKYVAKVLRPGIQRIVETDLKAVAFAMRWLKFYKAIRRRVDLDWFVEEFTTVTLNELDLVAEGRNIERFARDFTDDRYVYVPKVIWKYSAARTLTMENVSFIKIGDIDGLKNAGINPSQVADKLYSIYMRQVFETNFVHVDPHPGNIFVKPLLHADEREEGKDPFGPDDSVPFKKNRRFQIVFVDFGMVAIIPERLRGALRDYAIGIGTRDAYKIVKSYVRAGTLLEGANLRRLEEAHDALFKRFWGVQVGKMRDVALNEARDWVHEYRDVIYEAPFQIQVDMLFVLRAIGILSGLATHLDPEFDPWAKTIPYAERFAKEELQQDWRGWLLEILKIGEHTFKLPIQINRVLDDISKGKIHVENSFSTDTRKLIERVVQSIKRLTWVVLSMGLLISGVHLHVGTDHKNMVMILITIAILVLINGLRKG